MVCNPTTLPTKTARADTGALPEEVILFQEEMNRTMGHLLMTRSSLDTCGRKQVSDFKTALHQNEAEAIREAKTHCGAAIRGAEAHCATGIREVEAQCSTTIMEAEACCAADIREAESQCVDHAHSIQQLHADGMQHLEMEAMEEEGRDCLSFLAACGVALQACPREAHVELMCPSNYSQETCSWPLFWPFPIRYLLPGRNLPLLFPVQLLWWHPGPPQGPNGNTFCLIRCCPCHSQETKLRGTVKGHPARNGKARCLLRNPWNGVSEKPSRKTQI